jgi:hypothetical protein
MSQREALAGGGHVTKLHYRPPLGFRAIKPFRLERVGFHLQVRLDLLGKIVGAAAA